MAQLCRSIIMMCVGAVLSPASAQQSAEKSLKNGKQTVIVAPAIGSKDTLKPSPQGQRPESARQLPNGLIIPPAYVKSAVQLRSMYLDQKLFEPNHWWSYEEADPDRPTEFSVAQETKVSLGGRFEPNHGGQVKYQVRAFPDANAAHSYFASNAATLKLPKKSTAFAAKALKLGDEGIVVEDTVIANGTPQSYARRSMIRFDRYVVVVDGNSNMRAFGPRPAHRERRWLSEPVYDAVFNAATAKWTQHKTL